MKNTITLKSSKSKSLKGKLFIPGDKSISIRALLMSSICFGNSKISNLLESEDIKNTISALKDLGIKIIKKKDEFEIYGNGGVFKNPSRNLYLGNSGTGLRLLVGLLSTRNINATFTGDDSLSSRPMMRIIEPLEKMHALIKHNNGKLPITLSDNDSLSIPIKYSLKVGSAQIKSAILLASLNTNGTTIIEDKFSSRDHTEIMLSYLGADIIKKKNTIFLNSPTFLKPKDISVPGDFSSAAFIVVATLITKNSRVILKNIGLNPLRTGLLEVLKKMNAKIIIEKKKIINGEVVGDIIVSSSELISTKVESSIAPKLIDEFPILFVAACFAKGRSVFKGLQELKFKESDRLSTMAEALRNSGVNVKTTDNSMEINGANSQRGGCFISTKNDHRIAMSMLIFGLASDKDVLIDDPSMIKTSFPNFKNILNKINAKIENVQK